MPFRAPAGNNTYIPSYDASGAVISFTRDSSKFRLAQYVKYVPVEKDEGYYLATDPNEPYRVVDQNDYLWEDGADAPMGNGEKLEHEYRPYRNVRVAYPFVIGSRAVEQAAWPILAAHAKKTAAKAMLVRTMRAAGILTTAANWGTNTVTAAGAWTGSTSANLRIQNTINAAARQVELATGGIVSDSEGMILVMNPNRARAIAVSPEYRDYILGSPDALASLTSQDSPNRKYGLAPYLYGYKLVIENAVRVVTRKGTAATPEYAWPDNAVVLMSRPDGVGQTADDDALEFSTLAFRFSEEMTVESKDDPDNRRVSGRVVENYSVVLQAPQTGCFIDPLAI